MAHVWMAGQQQVAAPAPQAGPSEISFNSMLASLDPSLADHGASARD